MSAGILKAQGLCKSYKDKEVLHDLDLTIEPGKIYGLIGRNGAGKTTLLGILTAQNTKDSGEVTYNGQPVWENQRALNDICFSRELQATLFSGPNNLKVKHYLKSASIFYSRWDRSYASRLLDEFKLEKKKRISQLSKGEMSMVTIRSFRFLLSFAWVHLAVLYGFAVLVVAGCYATGIPDGDSQHNLFENYYSMFPFLILLCLFLCAYTLCTNSLNLALSMGVLRRDFFWALQGIILFYSAVCWVLQWFLSVFPAAAHWGARDRWCK